MPVLAHQQLVDGIRGVSPMIIGARPITDKQIQMASVDLTLGGYAYCMRASALPRERESVQILIDTLAKHSFGLSPDEGKILHRGLTYIIPLNESLRLPKNFSAKCQPKSSIGRIDVFVRVLTDRAQEFDRVHSGYVGPLYLEVTPLSFDIFVRQGQALVQMRIRNDQSEVLPRELLVVHSREGIIWGKNGKPLHVHEVRHDDHGIYMHVDLERSIVGFEAKKDHLREIWLEKENAYEPEDFWRPIKRPADGCFVIEPDHFYLFATCERIKIPAILCGDIAPYDASAGEFRSHYAGFFDPGFGGVDQAGNGSAGVMEVRGREIPQRLSHGSPICRMDFECMAVQPDMLYGAQNNYTSSGPSLAKYFRRREEIWEE